MYRDGVSAYQQTNVVTADPKRLVIMCYEGAISNLKIAKARYLSGEYESKAKAMQKAQDIISELIQALDFEKGGEIARGLVALYNYVERRLLDAEVKRDIEAIDEVVGILYELKGAWEEIFYGGRKETNPAPCLSNGSNKQGVVMAYAPMRA